MIKYEIMTDSFEFRMGTKNIDKIPAMTASEIFDTYMSCDTRITSNSLDPVLNESFSDEKEAVEFFKANYSNYGQTRLEHGDTQYLLTGDLAWLAISEYDDDDDEELYSESLGVLAVSAEPYEPED